MELVLGSDVEFFLKNKLDRPLPVTGLVGATKSDKRPLIFPEGLTGPEGGFVHEDNVMLELNSPVFRGPSAPQALFSFVKNFSRHYRHFRLYEGCSDHRVQLHPGCVFTNTSLNSAQARTFGCSGFESAYRSKLKRPDAKDFNNIRTAGMHLHLDLDEDVLPIEAFVHLLDLILYYPVLTSIAPYVGGSEQKALKLAPTRSRFLSNGEAIAFRLQNYGKPGAYRRTPYGVEYRSLPSDFTFLPKITKLTKLFNAINTALPLLQKEYFTVPWTSLKGKAEDYDWAALQHDLEKIGSTTIILRGLLNENNETIRRAPIFRSDPLTTEAPWNRVDQLLDEITPAFPTAAEEMERELPEDAE